MYSNRVAISKHYVSRLDKLLGQFINLFTNIWNIRKNNLHIFIYISSLQLIAVRLISQINAIAVFYFR